MTVTIKDVAALAGVSPSTVSRTCKNNPSISAKTKEKVRKAMAELGYEPNFQASNLASQNSRTIGIVLPASEQDVYENPFYTEIIRGISQFFNQRQYMNTVITGRNEEELLDVMRSTTKSGKVEGFILLYSKENDTIIDYLDSEGILYVLVGQASKNSSQTICIDNDNIIAGSDATEYLLSHGHSRIGFLSGISPLLFIVNRKLGYQLALTRHGIPIKEDYCVEFSATGDIGHNQLRALLTQEDKPTALVVSDDILAVALERICYDIGLSIPKDLSIISFNNSLFAQLTYPQLTSIDINTSQLGIEAASQIINHIENPNLVATRITVPHSLVERESVAQL